MAQKTKMLLDQIRDLVHLKLYAYRTEQSYVAWVRRYILLHNKTHPKDMGENEVQEFLAYLSPERKVSASTHTCPPEGHWDDVAGGARGSKRSAP